MKIEAGKYYRTRDGRKVGPMRGFCRQFDLPSKANSVFGAIEGSATMWWSWDGSFLPGPNSTHPIDLVSEWADAPKTWGDMTDTAKVQSLAEAWSKHNGETCEDLHFEVARSVLELAGAIKPQPVTETVTLHYGPFNITFTKTDGKPATGTFLNEAGDVNTMERIND